MINRISPNDWFWSFLTDPKVIVSVISGIITVSVLIFHFGAKAQTVADDHMKLLAVEQKAEQIEPMKQQLIDMQRDVTEMKADLKFIVRHTK